MRVLIACEESQVVCNAFREHGHEAYSCDIQDCSGGHPEWHIKGDVIPLLNGDCGFVTVGGIDVSIEGKWDLIIAHPPCDHLAVSGARWFQEKQKDGRQQKAIVFFMICALANCDRIAVENPVSIMATAWRKPDQIIQPYEYGHPYTKKTCLWLKGLQPLTPTKIVERPKNGWLNQQISPDGRIAWYGGERGRDNNGKWMKYSDPVLKTERSRTFAGIAEAFARQWGDIA